MMLRPLLLCTALLAGCYSEEPDVVYGGGAAAYDGAPGLVQVSPGVDVISDYDYPVFYSDNLYWRYDGGIWYQSSWYGGGWGVAYNVPYGVRGIRNPGAYTHYHGGAGVRDHRGGGYNGGGFARRGGYNGGYRAAPVRSSPGQYRSAPAARSFGGARGGGGGGFHGGGGGHGGGHGGHR